MTPQRPKTLDTYTISLVAYSSPQNSRLCPVPENPVAKTNMSAIVHISFPPAIWFLMHVTSIDGMVVYVCACVQRIKDRIHSDMARLIHVNALEIKYNSDKNGSAAKNCTFHATHSGKSPCAENRGKSIASDQGKNRPTAKFLWKALRFFSATA